MPMYRKSLIALALIIGVISVFMLFGSTKGEEVNLDQPPVALEEDNKSEDASKEDKAKEGAKEVAVYITGEVAKPGVVLLSSTSRLAEAVEACGNFTAQADVDKVNLALTVEDGMEVKVPAKNPAASGANNPNTAGGNASPAGDLININTANEGELVKLPGIGPGTAKKILEYRSQKGNFTKIEDLRKVKGIGKVKYEKIQDKIRV